MNSYLEIETIVSRSSFQKSLLRNMSLLVIIYNLPVQNIFSNGQVVLALSNIGIVSDKTFKALPSFNFSHANWDGTDDDRNHGIHQSQEGSKEIIIQMSHPRPLLDVQALEQPYFCQDESAHVVSDI